MRFIFPLHGTNRKTRAQCGQAPGTPEKIGLIFFTYGSLLVLSQTEIVLVPVELGKDFSVSHANTRSAYFVH